MPKTAWDLSSDVFPLYGRCFVRCFLSAVGIIVAVGGVVRMLGIMMEGKMVGDFIMEKFRICGRGRRRSWIFILIIIPETDLELDLELLQEEEEWVNPL